MKLALFLLSFSFALHSAPIIYLSTGTTTTDAFNRGTTYGLSIAQNWRTGLGFDIGTRFMQTTNNQHDIIAITCPYAILTQVFKLNRLPFLLSLGAGFSLNHIPSDMGSRYVGTHLSAGLVYLMSPNTRLKAEYMLNYGERQHPPKSFDGQHILIGVGFKIKAKEKKWAPPQRTPPQKQINQKKRPNQRRQSSPVSPYQQTQKLMNELSWPTY